ncbi:hypothetical protein CDAR_596681 [Caerostris darwini]|uniref:Uncharacterized protein n=1 Tax=Caerostris darwini TaxID=1538125 RepID=A0AAV4WE17_9ARAC|nr:hypothetical protein CDAR_596681 [Caerostris darwini]
MHSLNCFHKNSRREWAPKTEENCGKSHFWKAFPFAEDPSLPSNIAAMYFWRLAVENCGKSHFWKAFPFAEDPSLPSNIAAMYFWRLAVVS